MVSVLSEGEKRERPRHTNTRRKGLRRTLRRRLSLHQEAGPRQTPNPPTPLSPKSQPLELWEINTCCPSHPVCCVLSQQPALTKTVPVHILLFLKPLTTEGCSLSSKQSKGPALTQPSSWGKVNKNVECGRKKKKMECARSFKEWELGSELSGVVQRPLWLDRKKLLAHVLFLGYLLLHLLRCFSFMVFCNVLMPYKLPGCFTLCQRFLFC